MEQHVNTLLTVYGEDLSRLRNRIGKDRSENTFRALKMGRDYVVKFLSERYGVEDIPMERLTPQFIQDFSICFAVLALTKGMPIESVSRILGHTNITTTQIYAKITMQKLNADMDDLEKQLHDLSSHF